MKDKQKRFCNEYLIDLNATQAAIRAGYSKKTAYSIGGELLKKPEIQEYLSKRQEARQVRTEITQDKVLKELAIVAFADATNYAKVVEKQATTDKGGVVQPLYDANGEPVIYRTVELEITDNLSDDQKRALAVIKKGRDGLEQKPHDKVRALELLGRHLGMFKDKVDVSGSMDVNNPYEGLSTEDLKKMIGDG